MTALHNCGECRHLVRTHPEQVFLLCTFWASGMPGLKGVAKSYGRKYVETHCHMQPWAEACPYFEQGKVMMRADAAPFRASASA